jgi:hypothetical protein
MTFFFDSSDSNGLTSFFDTVRLDSCSIQTVVCRILSFARHLSGRKAFCWVRLDTLQTGVGQRWLHQMRAASCVLRCSLLPRIAGSSRSAFQRHSHVSSFRSNYLIATRPLLLGDGSACTSSSRPRRHWKEQSSVARGRHEASYGLLIVEYADGKRVFAVERLPLSVLLTRTAAYGHSTW